MKKRFWKFVSFAALSSLFLLTAFSVVAVAGGATPKRAPMSAAYAKYLARKKAGTWHLNLAKGGHGMGRLPNRFDRSYLLKAARTERAAARAAAIRSGEAYKFTSPALSFMQRKGIVSATLTTPPSSFDLRSLGKIGPVEDQGNCGSCWDFAALASLESTLPKTVAFSENNMLDSDGFDWGPNDGGLDSLSIAYLTRCGVPKSETQYPYHYQWPSPYAPLADTSLASPAVRVNDVYTIPSDPADIRGIIWGTKSAVTISFYYDDSLYYQNAGFTYPATATVANFFNPYSSTNQYLTQLPNGGGHEVSVIGWDDNYLASNFRNSAGAVPPGPGAYLCRNQWGAYWGAPCGTAKYDNQGGYFWISYYDKSVEYYGQYSDLYKPSPAGQYTQVYQYDPLGATNYWGWSAPDGYMANVFKADNAGKHIKAVGFYVNDYSASYEIKIYDNVNTYIDANNNIVAGNSAPDPTAGTLVWDQYGGTLYSDPAGDVPAGYHTIKLNRPVPVTPGDNFSVVVYLYDNYGYPYPWAVEDIEPRYSDRAYSTTGQSYDSSDGVTWKDFYYDDSYTDPTTSVTTYYNGNACIKAYAAP